MAARSFRRLLTPYAVAASLGAFGSLGTLPATEAVAAVAAPSLGPVLHARSPSLVYAATIARTGTDVSGFARYELTWDTDTGRGHGSVSSEIVSISTFRMLDDGRALIVGATTTPHVWAFHVISVFDAKTLVVAACYAPAVSPDGRYVAYIRVHPQPAAAAGRAPVSLMSAEYRVLDLEASKPQEVRSAAVALAAPADADHTHVLAMPIVWDDSSHFHFGDRFRGKTTRISIAVGDDGRPTVQKPDGA